MAISLAEKTKICYKAVSDKKGNNIVILDLENRSSFTDYFFICSGSSTRQVQSIADEIVKCLEASGTKGINVEGYQTGKWVLVDASDIIVHIFHEEARRYYDLERLWGDVPEVKLAISN